MSTRGMKEGERDHWQIQKYILLLETREKHSENMTQNLAEKI